MPKAEIKSSFCVVARYLTEKRRFEPQNTVKIKCSQLSCDQPQKEDLIAALVTRPRNDFQFTVRLKLEFTGPSLSTYLEFCVSPKVRPFHHSPLSCQLKNLGSSAFIQKVNII